MKDYKLKEAKEYVESLGHKVYYIALYGSQNYWLDLDTIEYKSDVDYKCIIIPTLNDLVYNSKPKSYVVEFNWGQIDIKDIRVYVESLVKCNVNFLEILDSKYYIGDKEWREFLVPLLSESWQFYLKACYGMQLEKQAAMEHRYPSTEAKIDKWGYDPKQLHHIVRLYFLMRDYVNEGSWSIDFLHRWKEKEFLLDIKMWKYSLNEAREIMEEYMEKSKLIRDSYKEEPKFSTKEELIDFSREVIINNIRGSLYDELLYNNII